MSSSESVSYSTNLSMPLCFLASCFLFLYPTPAISEPFHLNAARFTMSQFIQVVMKFFPCNCVLIFDFISSKIFNLFDGEVIFEISYPQAVALSINAVWNFSMVSSPFASIFASKILRMSLLREANSSSKTCDSKRFACSNLKSANLATVLVQKRNKFWALKTISPLFRRSKCERTNDQNLLHHLGLLKTEIFIILLWNFQPLLFCFINRHISILWWKNSY